MPRMQYQTPNLRASTRRRIEQANEIIAEYRRQGYVMTLRQLYYQFVSRDLIPNQQSEYKRLVETVSQGRLAGLIDWEAIEDRTRHLMGYRHYDDVPDMVSQMEAVFRLDLWADQPRRVEVWVEKEALAGVVGRVCGGLDVPYLCCRGYTSQSEMWASGQRMIEYRHAKQNPLILYLGDHDPSGLDMTRDVAARLGLFALRDVEVTRLALNMDQVEEYDPPPNPVKASDARSGGYSDAHGDECWELDALPPDILAGLITAAVEAVRDDVRWERAVFAQQAARLSLRQLAESWDAVERFMAGRSH